MPIFYQCDFCLEKDRKLVQHDPNSPHKTIVGNSAVICEDCVRLAFEVVSGTAIKITLPTPPKKGD